MNPLRLLVGIVLGLAGMNTLALGVAFGRPIAIVFGAAGTVAAVIGIVQARHEARQEVAA